MENEQQIQLRRNNHGKRICKIVLTGGPCAGKTTAMNESADKIKRLYNDKWQAFVVSEASSFLYTGRVQRSELSDEQVNQWQMDVLTTILQLESVYDNIAEREQSKDTMIICDRGGMDPKAYTNGEEIWKDILNKLDVDEDKIFARYDAVIQMHTAPREYYSTVNNPYRRETYEVAEIINARYEQLWNTHPYYFVVENFDAYNQSDGWNQKSAKTFEIIEKFLSSQE
ncbi:AAA-28 domain-containing protein [Aphelenchoides bicaudatus]|nr:AAA-28 domain-containing protein [Aphelenchoides bicaudatus]